MNFNYGKSNHVNISIKQCVLRKYVKKLNVFFSWKNTQFKGKMIGTNKINAF